MSRQNGKSPWKVGTFRDGGERGQVILLRRHRSLKAAVREYPRAYQIFHVEREERVWLEDISDDTRFCFQSYEDVA
jgi:hypothetical protein